MAERYPLVTVEWADHFSEFDQGLTQEDIDRIASTVCSRRTSGHVVAISKRNLVLAGTLDEESFCEVFACMRKGILNIWDRHGNKIKLSDIKINGD